MFHELFKLERMPLEEAYRDRLEVSYRLVRELARIKGLVQDVELLSESDLVQDHWYTPVKYHHPHPVGPAHIRRANVSLCPPPVPRFTDPLLVNWIEVMEELTGRLGICSSMRGIRGHYKLLHPISTQEVFPKPDEIMAYEKYQVIDNLQAQIEMGTLRALAHIKSEESERLPLTAPEANRLQRLARSFAREQTSEDLDEKRALMELRIEALIKRIQGQDGHGDYRAEIQALRLLSGVQGLFDTKSDDELMKMIKAVKVTGRKTERLEAEFTSKPVNESKQLENKE